MASQTRSAASHAKSLKPPRVSRGEETKAYVLRCFANLVEEGVAQIKRSADGESELRLATGEVYRLNKKTVRRIV
jgi:hypothetical protein